VLPVNGLGPAPRDSEFAEPGSNVRLAADIDPNATSVPRPQVCMLIGRFGISHARAIAALIWI
jgi:hypothetical protein